MPQSDAEHETHTTSASRPRWQRGAKWLFLCALPLLVAVGMSLGRDLTRTSNLSLQERTVEWMRGHHLAVIVNTLENSYYKHHQPKVGGAPQLAQIGSSSSNHQTASSDLASVDPNIPAAITPVAVPAFDGEGQWKSFSDPVHGQQPIQVTYLRADTVHTSVIDAVVHINQHLVSASLMAGRTIPGRAPTRLMTVSNVNRPDFLGAFNSGFRIDDSHGGFMIDGHVYVPLVKNLASIIVHSDGTIDVNAWTPSMASDPTITAVRQNLALLVNNGAVDPGVDDVSNRRWGHTVSNQLFVWRSGLGVDAQGNLLYVAGDGLSVRTLAELLHRAGAVRAMELDINYPWVSYNMFQHGPDGAINPALATKLLPKMKKPATRYLSADDRDWIALLARP